MRFLSQRSIRTKYLLSGFAVCLVSLLSVSLISYFISYQTIARQSEIRIDQTALKNAAELDSWFKEQSAIIDNMSQDLEIIGNFNQDFLYRFLKQKYMVKNTETIDYYIGFEDPHRKLVSGSNWNPPSDYDCRIKLWYRQAWAAKKVVYSIPYIDAQTGKMVITVAKSLRQKGGIIGVLAANIDVGKILNIVRNYRLNEQGYAFLLDSSGYILVHPKKSFQPSAGGLKNIIYLQNADYSKLFRIIESRKIGIVEMKDYDGLLKYFILCRVNSCGWTFGITVLRTEYRKPLNNLLFGFVFAFFGSMVASIGIMFALISGMIKPIKLLGDTVKSFSSNNMNARSDIKSHDELGELSQNFNQMAETIQQYSISLENKVAERTSELQEKNDKIMESIDYAERIQRAVLPPLSSRLGIPDNAYFVIWKPRDIVGGDLYWCRGDQNYALLAVADCTGHGVPGALMTMALSSILDGIPRALNGKRPSELLQLIHTRLQETLSQDQEGLNTNDGADVALCLIDKENHKILFSGARLALFLNQDGEVMEYKGAKQSVGYAWRKPLRFEDHELAWNSNSQFYITTDGLLDQNMQEGKGGYGRTAFKEFLQSMTGLSFPQQKEAMLSLISERLAHVDQRDDILVIGFCLAEFTATEA